MTKEKAAFKLNAIIAILETLGLIIAIKNNGIGIMGYYTQESNLILLIASLLYVIEYVKKKKVETYLILTLKYVATCLVAVTFFVVVLCFIPICIPMMGFGKAVYAMLIRDANLFHHLLCPLLALMTYFIFEDELKPGFKESVYAMLPTLLYAIVSTSLNVAKVVEGPYPFLYVYEQPLIVSVLWFIAIPGGGWLFAWVLGRLKSKKRKKE